MKRLILLAAAFAATAASANVVWRGDFNTGDRSQWSGTEMVSSDRLQVVSSPTWEGAYALKATVVQGDNPINASGNRNEIYKNTMEPSGSEYYYRWAVYFPSSFPWTPSDQWQLFTQWHHDGCCGAPPLSFAVSNDKFTMTLYDTNLWTGSDFSRGTWHEFILHAKWSSNLSVGFLELWHNGQLVMPKKYGQNQNPGELNYLKMGLYRPETISTTSTIYLDGMTMGTTLADVTGAVTPAVDAGTPTTTVDAGTPSTTLDAGTPTQPTADAGTPTQPTADAGTPQDEQHPGSVQAGTLPGAGAGTAEPIPGGTTHDANSGGEPDQAQPPSTGAVRGGCSMAPLAAPFGLLGLLALTRLKRRRRERSNR